MIIHIFEREKFVNRYVDFINTNFNKNNHKFYIIGNKNDVTIDEWDNLIEIDGKMKNMVFLIKDLFISSKIIIHGLFNRKVIFIFFIIRKLLKKSYWTIWGGDLYWHEFRRHSIKEDMFEYMRKVVIKNLSGLITHIHGDYELAKKWYGAQGNYYYSFLYLSNVFNEKYADLNKEEKNDIYIQIGNSADPCNNHIDMLKKIQWVKDKNVKIICPLSYGNKEYAKKVINVGNEIFENKFIPIIKFQPIEEYLKTLSKIDIAIFNNNRQQAVGNITTLLGMGKKVYIRDDITTWNFAKEHKLKVYNINSELDNLLAKMPEYYINLNKENIRRNFSKERLKETWETIFNS